MDHTQHDYQVSDVMTVQGHQVIASDKLFVNPETGDVRVVHTTRLIQDFVCLRFPDLPKEHRVGDTTIHLPDERYFESTVRDATVVAVGPGRWRDVGKDGRRLRREVFAPTELRVGDRVLINAMYTQEGLLSEWDGERGDFRLVREEVIDAVLDASAHLEVA